MKLRKLSKRKIFMITSISIFIISVLVYGIRCAYFYHIEHSAVVENEK